MSPFHAQVCALGDADLTELACSGGVVVETDSAQILSPNYPDDHGNYEYCEWVLRPSGGAQVGVSQLCRNTRSASCTHRHPAWYFGTNLSKCNMML